MVGSRLPLGLFMQPQSRRRKVTLGEKPRCVPPAGALTPGRWSVQ